MRQARFWHYADNGPVRIKLDIGQTLQHSNGGPTDEGYSWTCNRWTFDGCTVTNAWNTQARDCDGRNDRAGIAICATARLVAGHHDADFNVTYPDWHQGEYRQRDHSAEAMNY